MNDLLVFQLPTVALSAVGLYTCWHFAAGQFNWSPKHRKSMEIICEEDHCTKLSDTPYYRLLYFPNWYFGTAFYLFCSICTWLSAPLIPWLTILGSLAAVGMGIILIWSLAVKLRFFCVYCYTAHAVNLLLLGLFITRLLTT